MKNDYSTIHAVCRECATAAGFAPKDKVVGVWMDECGICHERKPCTDLHHDWRRNKEFSKAATAARPSATDLTRRRREAESAEFVGVWGRAPDKNTSATSASPRLCVR